ADLRYERGGRSLRPLGDALERRQLRGATAVVTVSRPLADFLVGRGAARERTVVIPNAVDRGRFRPDPARRASVRRRLGLNGRVVVGFHGVFAPWYRLDALVDAIAGAENLALLLVGDGVERHRVEAAVERHRAQQP